MSGSIVIAHSLCDALLASDSNQLNLVVCGTENEELVSLVDPESHTDYEVRTNGCYFADMVEACQSTFAGKLIFETLPDLDGKRGRARLVRYK